MKFVQLILIKIKSKDFAQSNKLFAQGRKQMGKEEKGIITVNEELAKGNLVLEGLATNDDNESITMVCSKNQKKNLQKYYKEMPSKSKFDQEEIFLLDQVQYDVPKRLSRKPKREIRKLARFK